MLYIGLYPALSICEIAVDRLKASGLGFTQIAFELGEHLLDRIEIGRVCGQEDRSGTGFSVLCSTRQRVLHNTGDLNVQPSGYERDALPGELLIDMVLFYKFLLM